MINGQKIINNNNKYFRLYPNHTNLPFYKRVQVMNACKTNTSPKF